MSESPFLQLAHLRVFQIFFVYLDIKCKTSWHKPRFVWWTKRYDLKAFDITIRPLFSERRVSFGSILTFDNLLLRPALPQNANHAKKLPLWKWWRWIGCIWHVTPPAWWWGVGGGWRWTNCIWHLIHTQILSAFNEEIGLSGVLSTTSKMLNTPLQYWGALRYEYMHCVLETTGLWFPGTRNYGLLMRRDNRLQMRSSR